MLSYALTFFLLDLQKRLLMEIIIFITSASSFSNDTVFLSYVYDARSSVVGVRVDLLSQRLRLFFSTGWYPGLHSILRLAASLQSTTRCRESLDR